MKVMMVTKGRHSIYRHKDHPSDRQFTDHTRSVRVQMAPSLLCMFQLRRRMGAAALMQWLADDSRESSDGSMVAQSAGRFLRQLRQAHVDDEDKVEHPDPDLAFSSSPLNRLNLGMRRASIGDGAEADGAASQQSSSGEVEMGKIGRRRVGKECPV